MHRSIKVTEAVPNTMELAYDDWCIARMAEALGKVSDKELFMKKRHLIQKCMGQFN